MTVPGDKREGHASNAELLTLLAAIDRDSIGLTICELGEGVRISTPRVGGVATLLVLQGTMKLDIGGWPTRIVRAGELVLVPAGVETEMHSALSAPVRRIVGSATLVRRDGWMLADATQGLPCELQVAAARITGSSVVTLGSAIVVPLGRDAVGKNAVAMFRAEIARPRRGSGALSEALMSACMVLALRLATAGAGTADDPVADHRSVRLARAVALMKDRPGDPHDIAALATAAGMSRSTFTRHFTLAMNTSPMAFLLKLRLDEAAAALRGSQLPIKTIAASTGFASRSHFCRAFRAHSGMHPTAYRAQSDIAEVP